MAEKIQASKPGANRIQTYKVTSMPVPKKQPTSTLKRAVTGPMLMLFILGDVLGAGVYALVGTIAGEVGGAIWVALLVALGFALLTAGSYAELVTKYPHAGASAVFAAKAYKSPLVSFLVGFCMLAAAVTSAAGLSLAFAGDYLAAFVDISPYIAATIFLIFIALLNARGIKESLSANVVMTMVELSGLLLVIFAAAWFSVLEKRISAESSNSKRGSVRLLRCSLQRCWRSTHSSALKHRPTSLKKFEMCAKRIPVRCSGR